LRASAAYLLQPLTRCLIGNGEIHGRTQPFFGQMGTVVMLQEAISKEDVRHVFALGPNMLPQVRASECVIFSKCAPISLSFSPCSP
jgi:hypothetical protein